MSNALKVLALLGVIAVGAAGMAQCARAQDDTIKVGEVMATPFICDSRDLVEKQIDMLYSVDDLSAGVEKANEALHEAMDAGHCMPTGGAPGLVKEFGNERKPVKAGADEVIFRAIGVVNPEDPNSKEFWTGGAIPVPPTT